MLRPNLSTGLEDAWRAVGRVIQRSLEDKSSNCSQKLGECILCLFAVEAETSTPSPPNILFLLRTNL